MLIDNLIFDVGFHLGEDALYYLSQGYRVIGLDADADLLRRAKASFARYVNSGQLVLLNYAVHSVDDALLDFYVSRHSDWSSLNKCISSRRNSYQKTVKVHSKKLSSVIREFGTPYYCKIDVESCDNVCLESLAELPAGELPRFISVETVCLGEDETLSDDCALATLYSLHKLGYSRFKLVDQASLAVLSVSEPFYVKRSLFKKALRKALLKSNRRRVNGRLGYNFREGSTGPFGEKLEGEWLDFSAARSVLLFHKNMYLANFSSPFGFWCDWHATL